MLRLIHKSWQPTMWTTLPLTLPWIPGATQTHYFWSCSCSSDTAYPVYVLSVSLCLEYPGYTCRHPHHVDLILTFSFIQNCISFSTVAFLRTFKNKWKSTNILTQGNTSEQKVRSIASHAYNAGYYLSNWFYFRGKVTRHSSLIWPDPWCYWLYVLLH